MKGLQLLEAMLQLGDDHVTLADVLQAGKSRHDKEWKVMQLQLAMLAEAGRRRRNSGWGVGTHMSCRD